MNDESLQRANAFLEAVSSRVEVGEVLRETPAEIGRELGHPDPLATARAVRALIARRRLEPANGSYRLLDARPWSPKSVRRSPPSPIDRGEATSHRAIDRAATEDPPTRISAVRSPRS